MLWVFKASDPAHASLFQTGWFVESLMTQTLIIHIIRTNKIPFVQSHASRPLIFTTALGFTQLPPLYWPILLVTLLVYMVLTQAIKVWLLRKHWI